MIDILPQKSTLTARYYAETVLSEAIQSIYLQRRSVGTSKTLIVLDSDSAHEAKVTVTFLSQQNIQVLAHPPYSPDLAQCDFWLFALIKEKLAGSSPSTKKSWLGGNFPAINTPKKQ